MTDNLFDLIILQPNKRPAWKCLCPKSRETQSSTGRLKKQRERFPDQQ